MERLKVMKRYPGYKATKYEHLLPMLAEVEDSEEIDGLLILLIQWAGMWKQDYLLQR